METTKRTKLYALDMEWSDLDGFIQPLEIGLLPMWKKVDPYFSLIAPSDADRMNTRIYSFLRQKKKTIMTAPAFDSVIRDMRRNMIPDNVKAVALVWHDSTREYFIDACKRYKVRNPFFAVVSLKDIMIMGRKDMIGSFERAMSEYHINYQYKLLHHSSYDVIHLKSLYLRFRNRCDETERAIKLVVNKRTGMIHRSECRYASGAAERSCRSFEIDALFSGAGLCKKCCRKLPAWTTPLTEEEKNVIRLEDNVRRIKESKQFEETSIAGMCAQFGFDYSVNGRMIDIRTTCGRWRLYHDDKEVTKVYHGNHYGKNSRPGYHEQGGMRGSLYKVLTLIKRHDTAIDEHEVRQPKRHKDTTAQMVKKVSHHVKRNYYVEKDEWEDYYDKINIRKG